MPLILGTNSIKDTGYDVANSLRFDDGSSDSLTRTQTAGNRRTFTLSFWVKRSELGSDEAIFNINNGNQPYARIYFNDNGAFHIDDYDGNQDTDLRTNRFFRDVSAWYHIVVAYDTTQSTASNRIKLYVNGVQETSFSTETYPAQNFDTEYNNNSQVLEIGDYVNTDFFNGYLSEVIMIDGTALDPTSFGEFDSDSPTIWKPIDVSGLTFGTNGFYLDFEDSSALGNDAAGSNNFTVNNLTAIDQTTDTCTNNFCTVNSLDNYHQQATLSEGNTKITFKGPSSYYAYSTGTFGVASGKWYWETKATSAGNHNVYGISGRYVIAYNKGLGVNTDEYGYYNYNGNYTNASSDGSYAENSFSGGNVTWTTNDIIGIALDLDSGTNTVKFYKNNALIGTVNIIAPSSGFYYPAWNQFDNQAEVCQPNFGNPSYTLSSAQADANGYGAFEFAPPSGYFALCSKNLAEYG
jgi:hypothetical protein